MRIRYVATDDPTDNGVCEVFGLTFTRGEVQTVDDDIAAKLVNNPTFEVVAQRGRHKEEGGGA